MTYQLTGGDHGNYQVRTIDAVVPVAFVRRNQKGGGYTIESADGSKSAQIRNMPKTDTSAEQAAKIMEILG